MISKAVENITKADVDALLTNQVPEGKTIEYQLTLPGGKDDDKKELPADVSSFANAGVEAERGTPHLIA
jgi:hypothetical protein